jgi:hypothetical protein
MTEETHQKVKTAHLKRNAYLYIRQSTLRQVFTIAKALNANMLCARELSPWAGLKIGSSS